MLAVVFIGSRANSPSHRKLRGPSVIAFTLPRANVVANAVPARPASVDNPDHASKRPSQTKPDHIYKRLADYTTLKTQPATLSKASQRNCARARRRHRQSKYAPLDTKQAADRSVYRDEHTCFRICILARV